MSPFWDRAYGKIQSGLNGKDRENNLVCKKNDDIIKTYELNGIIVGHTPQAEGQTTTCGHTVIRIDTAMSDAFGKKDGSVARRPQVLIITPSGDEKTPDKIETHIMGDIIVKVHNNGKK